LPRARRLPARWRHDGADAITVDVAILGELEAAPVLRSGARPGHLLAVTGELGASAAGLLALEGGVEGFERLKGRHLRPRPRLRVGRAAARVGAGAMVDLSDGLASDARRICEMSGVGCMVDLDKLPISDDTLKLAARLGRDLGMLAATGGEDYELLVCAPERILGEIAEAAEVPLTVVGEVTGSGEVVFRRGAGVVEDLSGWDHFA